MIYIKLIMIKINYKTYKLKLTNKIKMIINLLLIIPVIGSIIIGIMPVSEISEKEAATIYKNNSLELKKEGESSFVIPKEEIEKILKQENYKRTRSIQIVGLIITIITFIVIYLSFLL